MHLRGNLLIKVCLISFIFFVLYQFVSFLTKDTAEKSEKSSLKVANDNEESNIKLPVKVTVYYEALCPDSRNFVLRQLLPYYTTSKIIDYQLVPYGKAKTEEIIPPGNRYNFHCQHGSVECHANKIHACAIEYIQDKMVLLRYIACMIRDNMNPEEVAQECSNQEDVNLAQLLHCANGAEGEILLKQYGEMTFALTPRVTFIPTITLNGDQYKQAHILKNLKKSVCSLFSDDISIPEECNS